jgi:hypothetical protein
VRGSPLVRALIAFLGLLLTGFPIYRLTRSEGAAPQIEKPAVDPANPGMRRGAQLQLTFTSKPAAMKVLYLGKEIWTEAAPSLEMERKVNFEFPREGVDLQFEVEWPAEPLAAMRAVLIDSDGEAHAGSLFGKGSVSEVLTFQ